MPQVASPLSTGWRFFGMRLALDSDFTSGFGGSREERPAFDALAKDAARRRFDMVTGPQPPRPCGLPLRPSRLRDRPVLAPAGARYDHAERPDDVPDVGCLRRVRASYDPRAGEVMTGACQGAGEDIGPPSHRPCQGGGHQGGLWAGRAGIIELAGLHGVNVGTVQRIKAALAG